MATRPKVGAAALRRHLATLVSSVTKGLDDLDVSMKQPASVERGRAVARVLNAIELANDIAARFALGVLDKGPKPETAARLAEETGLDEDEAQQLLDRVGDFARARAVADAALALNVRPLEVVALCKAPTTRRP